MSFRALCASAAASKHIAKPKHIENIFDIGKTRVKSTTARTCIHDAFTAAFALRCEELTAACAATPGTNCDEITARCANGLGAPDAGTCQAP